MSAGSFFLTRTTSVSGGVLGDSDSRFRRWDEIVAHGVEAGVRWATVKLPRRAVEKVVRVYGRDPTRLVDLCRQAIVFRTACELLEAFREITQDEVCSPSKCPGVCFMTINHVLHY